VDSTTLRTFLTVVETGSLVRAATRLNVTPSTVTTRLSALERKLGQELLIRRKSGAELTSAGFKFLRYAQLMTDLWRQARQEAALPAEMESVCNLGCHFDLWAGVGRAFFERLRTDHPRVAVAAWPGEQPDMDRWLGSGLVDAVFCYSPSLREPWTAQPLGADRLVLVSTVPRGRVRWDSRYVYVDFGEAFRRAHATAYPDGDTPTVVFGCAAWALDHILAWGGSAYLPDRLAKPHIAAGRLHPVPDTPTFERTAYFVADKTAAARWPWLETLLADVRLDRPDPAGSC